jgi:Fic family protein
MAGNERSGFDVLQPAGYSAFIPKPLPPNPSLDLGPLARSLSAADQAVGRLDGATGQLPDVGLFQAMYVRREALLSSQIEGTDCTLDDVLAFELEPGTTEVPVVDVQEVVNYVAALNYGLSRLIVLPLSGRLLREVHQHLLRSGRGSDRTPGEFRKSQNWIGPPGRTLAAASFVPPPYFEMVEAWSDLEKYIHVTKDDSTSLPILIVCGLVHAQFETIHPFLDGNGRVGRLLITMMLCERQVLSAPVLNLSIYLRRNRTKYFEHLMAVRRDGTWEKWIGFFLQGVEETAREAAHTAQSLHVMRERHRTELRDAGGTTNDLALLDLLYSQPLVNAKWVTEQLRVTPPTANAILARFESIGALREVTGKARNRMFRYDEYVELFELPSGTSPEDETAS